MGHSAPDEHRGEGAGSSARRSLCCICYRVAPQHLRSAALLTAPIEPTDHSANRLKTVARTSKQAEHAILTQALRATHSSRRKSEEITSVNLTGRAIWRADLSESLRSQRRRKRGMKQTPHQLSCFQSWSQRRELRTGTLPAERHHRDAAGGAPTTAPNPDSGSFWGTSLEQHRGLSRSPAKGNVSHPRPGWREPLDKGDI